MTVEIFQGMIGVTMSAVTVESSGEEMRFVSEDGSRSFLFHHSQECCESVGIEDVCGDLTDLVGSPILMAEEVSNDPESEAFALDHGDVGESYTWTFYKFATVKGSVTVRWLGTSNGHYSESVSFDDYTREAARG